MSDRAGGESNRPVMMLTTCLATLRSCVDGGTAFKAYTKFLMTLAHLKALTLVLLAEKTRAVQNQPAFSKDLKGRGMEGFVKGNSGKSEFPNDPTVPVFVSSISLVQTVRTMSKQFFEWPTSTADRFLIQVFQQSKRTSFNTPMS